MRYPKGRSCDIYGAWGWGKNRNNFLNFMQSPGREERGMAEVQSNTEQAIKILITDRIAQEGIDLLHSQLPEAQVDQRIGLKPEQLESMIGDYTALIVRSETRVTGDILAAAKRLRIVGRAGVGVDNIDTE